MRFLLLFLVVMLTVYPGVGQQPQQGERQASPAFESLFSIRGVEFTEEQKAKVERLREEFVPKLLEINRTRAQVMSTEQRQTWQRALRSARGAQKTAAEAREAANVAARLTAKQISELTSQQQQYAELIAKIQGQVRALLTDDQKQQTQRGPGNRKSAAAKMTPSSADVKYGPHQRNVMDVWTADSGKPTPVLVSIHGGGFRGGNKGIEPSLLAGCLESRISVVAITYRLSDEAIAPAQFHDVARAIQFIRHNAQKWNFDPKRIAATGGSAGAGLSLWLGFHNDMAAPDGEDPVLRQSTRLSCMAVYNGQTSYDPRVIRELFADTDTYRHPALSQLFDIDFAKLDQLPDEKYQLFEQVSALPHVSKDDVPVLLMYASEMDTKITNQSIGIHHPRFAKMLKEKMDTLGVHCTVETGVRRGDKRFTELTIAFLKEHLQP